MRKLNNILLIAIVLIFGCNSKEDLDPQINDVIPNAVENCVDTSFLEQEDYISIEEARKELEDFLNDYSSIRKSTGSNSSKKIGNAFTLTSSNQSISKSAQNNATSIHIFNFKDDEGFAIMAATREMPSLLAITDGGNIDTTHAIDNPILMIFLNRLECRPANLKFITNTEDSVNNNHNDEYTGKDGSYTVYGQYQTKYYKPMDGYCKVHWRQDTPFNNQCPIKYGHRTIVGCVAVACAQLMSIYRYPSKYHDTTLHWSQMLANETNPDIAWLMKKLGDKENLNMNYNIKDTGSSANPALIPRTLENFGYSDGGKYRYYNSAIVCEELEKGYPVLIGGFDTKNKEQVKTAFGLKDSIWYSGGHRWLGHGLMVRSRNVTRYTKKPKDMLSKRKQNNEISGYSWTETDKYILCNFGWGISDESNKWNGYFLSSVFDAENARYSEPHSKDNRHNYFQYEITSITGIRK